MNCYFTYCCLLGDLLSSLKTGNFSVIELSNDLKQAKLLSGVLLQTRGGWTRPRAS